MRVHAGMLILFLSLAVCSSSYAQGPDNSTIPPNILKQMEPDICSNKRPKIVVLAQNDIFKLEETPKIDADFVQFSFAPPALSTAQNKVLLSWVSAGHNKILLRDGQIATYAEPQTKSDVLQMSEAWDQKVVATDLGYFFSDVV